MSDEKTVDAVASALASYMPAAGPETRRAAALAAVDAVARVERSHWLHDFADYFERYGPDTDEAREMLVKLRGRL